MSAMGFLGLGGSGNYDPTGSSDSESSTFDKIMSIGALGAQITVAALNRRGAQPLAPQPVQRSTTPTSVPWKSVGIFAAIVIVGGFIVFKKLI